MRTPDRNLPRTLAAVLAAALAASALGVIAADDVFDFIPSGGRTLLAQVLSTPIPAAEMNGLVSGKRDRGSWLAYIREHKAAVPALQRLTDKEATTLADYLSFNTPLPPAKLPASPTQANWAKTLPPDGRDFALDYCQNCHIITVVITQDRSKDAWMGTMGKPSHVQIKLSKEQREALASYLIVNAAIPIDKVPEDLRAGGATY